jgi:hypothetical protein
MQELLKEDRRDAPFYCIRKAESRIANPSSLIPNPVSASCIAHPGSLIRILHPGSRRIADGARNATSPAVALQDSDSDSDSDRIPDSGFGFGIRGSVIRGSVIRDSGLTIQEERFAMGIGDLG